MRFFGVVTLYLLVFNPSFGQAEYRSRARSTRATDSLKCEELRQMYSCRENQSYKVHLTFDDGPHFKNTPLVLDTLKRNKIPATFFVMGEKLASGDPRLSDIARRMKREGHTVGSHSFSHEKHTEIKVPEARELITRSLASIGREIDEKVTYFRLPYGDGWDEATYSKGKTIGRIIAESGLTHVGWHIDSGDTSFNPRTKGDHIGTLLRSICEMQGGVILMHDTIDFTAKTLARQIEAIKCVGHTFSGLNEFADDPYFKIREDDRALLPRELRLSRSYYSARTHQHSTRCQHRRRASKGWLEAFFEFMK